MSTDPEEAILARLAVWFEDLRSRLWLIPASFAIGAMVLALALVALDRSLGSEEGGPFVFGGGPDSARSILATIATAMLTFTGLVFTVTMLVLQLASSQLSPRVMRTFLRDRGNQVVLGIFVATLVYALFVLREVRSGADGAFVPSIAVWWAFALLLASLAAFIYYIDHMAHSMRASAVIRRVADETRSAIDRRYPDPYQEQGPGDPVVEPPVIETVLSPDRQGVLQAIDGSALMAIARRGQLVLEVTVRVGQAVPGEYPVVRVRGSGSSDHDAIRAALTIGPERTMDQDPAFGFRQLVDIATRALSPGINDPTTAHEVVDQLHDLLRRLGRRQIPGHQRIDDDGNLRLLVSTTDWDDYVALACDEIRQYGATSTQVTAALDRMIDDLIGVVPGSRRPAIDRQRRALDAARGHPA